MFVFALAQLLLLQAPPPYPIPIEGGSVYDLAMRECAHVLQLIAVPIDSKPDLPFYKLRREVVRNPEGVLDYLRTHDDAAFGPIDERRIRPLKRPGKEKVLVAVLSDYLWWRESRGNFHYGLSQVIPALPKLISSDSFGEMNIFYALRRVYPHDRESKAVPIRVQFDSSALILHGENVRESYSSLDVLLEEVRPLIGSEWVPEIEMEVMKENFGFQKKTWHPSIFFYLLEHFNFSIPELRSLNEAVRAFFFQIGAGQRKRVGIIKLPNANKLPDGVIVPRDADILTEYFLASAQSSGQRVILVSLDRGMIRPLVNFANKEDSNSLVQVKKYVIELSSKREGQRDLKFRTYLIELELNPEHLPISMKSMPRFFVVNPRYSVGESANNAVSINSIFH